MLKSNIDFEISSGRPIIIIKGELTGDHEERIIKEFDNFDKKLQKNVIIDLTHVSYMNSAGIAIIIQIIKKLRRYESHLNIVGLNKYFLKLFNTLGITDYIQFYKNMKHALGNDIKN